MPYKRKEKSRKPWLAQVKINNKYVRKSFATKREAVAWEVEQKKSVILLTPTTSLGEWAISYLDFSQDKFVSKTYQEKRAAFKFFFQSVDKELPVDQLTAGIVLKHLQIQNRKRSGYAANKDRKNLVAAWNWGIKYLGLPRENPCLVERFPEIKHTRYVPSEKDFWKVYEAAWTEQDAIMLLAYLHLAARKSELFRLKWEDVDLAEEKIRLYARKTKDGSWESSWLPMTEDLYNGLLLHKGSRISDIWVFPDPETGQPYIHRLHWMKHLCRRAKVKHFGLHAIRHLTASILAKEGIPMIDIQTILRHKNLSTTERYIRRIESVRPVLNVLPKLKNHLKPPERKTGTQRCSLSACN